MKKIYDVSILIRNSMPTWPGDPVVENRLVSSLEKNGEANVTYIQMSAHTGTHIDSPKHFINDGKSIDRLDLNILLGQVEVIEIENAVTIIDRAFLEKLARKNWPSRVFFKTNNSNRRLLENENFDTNFSALSPGAASYLVEHGVRLIGIDYLSIAPFENGTDTHIVLLSNDVIVIEGLNLADIQPGTYEMVALPILLDGADGAPARVLLIE